jgi:ferredoxin
MGRDTSGQGVRSPSAPGPSATALDYSNGYMISSDCMDCGVCEYMCPQGAIFEAKRQFVIHKAACNGCGECVPYCPARAIVPRTGFHDRQDRTVRNVLGAVLAEG